MERNLVVKTDSGKEVETEFSENDIWMLDDESGGICLACGEYEDGRCEPDAEGYECSNCGERRLTGVAQVVLMGRMY